VKAAWKAHMTAVWIREAGGISEYPTITHVRATSTIAGPKLAPSQSMIIGPAAVRITFCGCRSVCSST
jgi:hypothetical protein